MFNKINYSELTAKQKVNYKFQKVAAILAEYGYNCVRLTDDDYADFMAHHIDDITTLKVQLKGRAIFDKKYQGKGLYIAFLEDDVLYLYPHDEVLNKWLAMGKMKDTESWDEVGVYSYPKAPVEFLKLIEDYRLI